MRCFVLCTGRCGSTTLVHALGHCTNFTVAHESRSHLVHHRFAYPDGHIEVDNRLSWFLGTLDRMYGTDPVYVHLTRDADETARSYSHRFRGNRSIVKATANGIVQQKDPPTTDAEWLEVSRLVVQTVTDNIEAFLRDKPPGKIVRIDVSRFRDGLDELWDTLGCEGDLEAARAELMIRYNKRQRRG